VRKMEWKEIVLMVVAVVVAPISAMQAVWVQTRLAKDNRGTSAWMLELVIGLIAAACVIGYIGMVFGSSSGQTNKLENKLDSLIDNLHL